MDKMLRIGPEGGSAVAAMGVGERIELRLAERPTTGYRWQARSAGPIEQVADTYQGPAAPAGAGGERVLTFAATAAGTGEVTLALRRAWGDPSPAATARVVLTIT